MKRFYKEAVAVPVEGGHEVHLDSRPVRTPARATLLLPTPALGAAVAAEWAGQGEEIDPRAMMMTGLSNAAIDEIAPNAAKFAAGIAAYGESDLLCYRADSPAPLVQRQAEQWDPLLEWAAARYAVTFAVTSGVLHVAQKPETLARMQAVVGAFDPFLLAGLSTLVTISGSLVCGLALVENAFDPDAVWQAAELDELWQAEQWGDDAEAEARREKRRTEFDAAVTFCRMLSV